MIYIVAINIYRVDITVVDSHQLIDTPKGHLVLLFFDGYDLKASQGLTGRIKSFAHYNMRRLKKSLCGEQVHTGFYIAFKRLCDSLEAVGCDVRINDFDTARKHPHYPIGVSGFPSVLDAIHLPNPKIFGPGDWGNPKESKRVVDDESYKYLIQPSDWFRDIYKPYCKDKAITWFAGINSDSIPDFSHHDKSYDFLIYDKIHWERDTQEKDVLHRIQSYLDQKGLSYQTLRYGRHRHSQYMKALKDSKAMIYLSQHETQGLACQEAMAANIPVLAWDEGIIIDPSLKQYQDGTIKVSSVPYFDERCGVRFKITDFEERCDHFMNHISEYKGRAFIEDTLSLRISGQKYFDLYKSLL